MNLFSAVWQGHKAARLLLAAANAASNQDYLVALDRLQAAFDLGLPKHVEYTTLHGFLLSATGDAAAALEAYRAAFAMVDDAPGYTAHDRAYLKAYIADGANSVAGRLPGAPALPPRPDLSTMKLRKVRSLIKAMFPLPEHPA